MSVSSLARTCDETRPDVQGGPVARRASIAIALVVMLMWNGQGRSVFAQEASLPVAPEPSPISGFATPEEAVCEYVAGVAHADIERVLRTSAAAEMTRGFRFELLVDRVRAFTPAMSGPVHTPFFAEIQESSWRSQLLSQVRMLAYSLLAPDDLGPVREGTVLADVGSAWAQELMADLDPTRLASLVVADIGLPEPEMYQSSVNVANMAKLASIYSADELTDRVALLTFEGEQYAIGFTLLRYGDGWKVYQQSSPISGIPPFGVAQPMTADEFVELTSD